MAVEFKKLTYWDEVGDGSEGPETVIPERTTNGPQFYYAVSLSVPFTADSAIMETIILAGTLQEATSKAIEYFRGDIYPDASEIRVRQLPGPPAKTPQ